MHLPITTQYRIWMHLRYIAVENIVRKGEIACNKQFLLFSQCFLPYMVLLFHFKCTLKCHLQFVPIWTCLKFCCLVMGKAGDQTSYCQSMTHFYMLIGEKLHSPLYVTESG